ncbi:MAG: sugar phosphate isomerase/epimerase [Planctomycetes bacterium]|nr:sugar phosphate isomerase/epimerase [Planctomycetota bacterium]
MARLSINELTTFRWTFDQDVQQLIAGGFKSIGVWRHKLDDFGRERGVDLLASSGLEVSNLAWAGGFTASDGRTLRESIDDALDAIALAAELRAATLLVYSGPRAGHTNAHARRLFREALKQLVPAAEQQGVTLALKPVHALMATEWSFLVGLDEPLALVQEFNSPRLKLAIDTYQTPWDDKGQQQLAAAAPHVALVQLADGRAPTYCEERHTPLGEGEAPLLSLIAALERGGYRGDYDVVLMGLEVPPDDYPTLLRKTHSTFKQLLPVASSIRESA